MTTRPAVRADLDAIVALERATFPRPWSAAALAEEIAGGRGRLVVVAVDPGDRVVGYLCCRDAAAELHILSLAVAAACRRMGVGTGLLRSALEWGERQGCRGAVLEVRPTNTAAIELYRRLGFVSVGRRPAAYSDNDEDALILIRPLGHP